MFAFQMWYNILGLHNVRYPGKKLNIAMPRRALRVLFVNVPSLVSTLHLRAQVQLSDKSVWFCTELGVKGCFCITKDSQSCMIGIR